VSVRAAVVHAPVRFGVERFPAPRPRAGGRRPADALRGRDRQARPGAERPQSAGTGHEGEAAYPLICGHENVGVIEAIGPGPPPVDEIGRPLRVGDRVVPAANLTCGRCEFCLE
jgi:threonine dehydrogenase-like Zn-dependent dehydrogenase